MLKIRPLPIEYEPQRDNTPAEDIFPDYKILPPWHGTGIRAIRRNDEEFKCGLLLPD